MGGSLECESEYGRGSRFEATVSLEKTLSTSSVSGEPAPAPSPLQPGRPVEDPPPHRPAPPPGPRRRRLSLIHI